MEIQKRKSLILIVLLLLIGVTSGYVAKTYAKYTAEVSGNGAAVIAKWNFDTENEITTINVALDETYDSSTLVEGKIAPGTVGSFAINLTNADSEVGVDFEINIGTVSNVPTNLKLYSDDSYTTELTTANITGQISAGDSTGIEAKIYWKWEYETGSVTNGIASGDSADTTDGKSAKTLTVPVIVKGVQTEPGVAITTHIN